jgi:hypothetical protein
LYSAGIDPKVAGDLDGMLEQVRFDCVCGVGHVGVELHYETLAYQILTFLPFYRFEKLVPKGTASLARVAMNPPSTVQLLPVTRRRKPR